MSLRNRPRLGLVGLGKFGRFAAEHLREHFDVVATDCRNLGALATRLGTRWGTLADAAGCPYVVVAVPLAAMPDILSDIAPQLQPGTLVIDVGSVKAAPVRWMIERLPSHVEILGSHPLFGPQSAVGGLHGQRIVLCPVRTTRLAGVQIALESVGLQVVVTDPDEHDRQVAHTQALSQLIGRALADAGFTSCSSEVRTPAFDKLCDVARTVGEDSWELFSAIQNLNPHTAPVRDRLLQQINLLIQRLHKGT